MEEPVECQGHQILIMIDGGLFPDLDFCTDYICTEPEDG